MKVDAIDTPEVRLVGAAADSIGRECYAVGGYVRDIFLGRHSKDIDFVTIGSGIEVAEAVAATLGKGTSLNVFRNFGTAQVKRGATELEFVGARKESYSRDSRKPIVEDGTLEEDLSRRDFTINALAVRVNHSHFGELTDLFGGIADMKAGIIRTPLDPDVTFSDDPLRMMRAIRFATQLDFKIFPDTFEAIRRNAERISIISRERIADELTKIMKSATPSTGWRLLADCGLLKLIFPELAAMRGVDVRIIIPHIPDKKYTFELSKASALPLAAKGVRFYEYTPGFMHAKSMVCDDSAFIGTYNFDFRSMRLNYECGIMFKGEICEQVETGFLGLSEAVLTFLRGQNFAVQTGFKIYFKAFCAAYVKL